MATKRTKGGEFERSICKALSTWLSAGKSDAELWRASQSGGRATQRSKFGKRTEGHYGDITASTPLGRRWTDLVTTECKSGYHKTCLFDLLDSHYTKPAKKPKRKPETTREFIRQAKAAAKEAKTEYWCVIHRRTGRRIIIYARPSFFVKLNVTADNEMTFLIGKLIVRAMRFEEFLEKADPKRLRREK